MHTMKIYEPETTPVGALALLVMASLQVLTM